MNKDKESGRSGDNSALVRCPTCGNDELHALVWDDPDGGADFVRCAVCGTRYDPITGELEWPF